MKKPTKDQFPTKTASVPTLDGPKQYEFVLLKRREAVEVNYLVTSSLLAGAGSIIPHLLGVVRDDEKIEDALAASSAGIAAGLSRIPFATLWKIGSAILRGVTIDEDTLIENLDETNYFAENPEEFYAAIVVGIEVNNPKVFSRLREAVKGSGLSGLLKKVGGSPGSSKTSEPKTEGSEDSGTQS